MNWDAISAFAEVLGATGVIVTLVYLATQIRDATKTAQDASFREVFSGAHTSLRDMFDDSNLDSVLTGLVSYDDLEASQKFKFDGTLASFLTYIESSIIANDAKLIPDEKMEGFAAYMRPRFFAYPGFVQWWALSRDCYIRKAQAWIDNEIENARSTDDFWGIM